MKTVSSKQGIALIFVVATLMLLVTMAIGFSRMTTIETKCVGHATESANARLVAQAGVSYATMRLRQDFAGELVDVAKEWMCWVEDRPPAVEDDNGAGTDRVFLTQYDATWPRRPSYVCRNGTQDYYEYPDGTKRRFSGYLRDAKQVYTLKILDTTSQLNLNSHSDADIVRMGNLLLALSRAITLRTGYSPASDATLKTVYQAIFQKRTELGGFTAKEDILQATGMTQEILQHLWDYYTVYPTMEEMRNNDIYRTIRRIVPGNENQYAQDYRSPINVNTAPWPVLVAVLCDLEKRDDTAWPSKIADTVVGISQDEAINLADKICQERHKINFASFQNFFAFVDREKNTVFMGSSAEQESKAALVKANASPHVYLRKYNPDAVVYQAVNKLDLSYYTTEFCFFPYGLFEIYSLGEILDDNGSTLAQSEYYCVAEVFSLARHKTQEQLENATRSPAPDGRGLDTDTLATNHHATHVKNYQDKPLGTDPLMEDFGYVEPVTNDDKVLFGNSTLHSNLKFKALFNGDLNITATKNNENVQLAPLLAGMSNMSVSQNLVSDGVLWLPNTTFCHIATEKQDISDIDPDSPLINNDANVPPKEGTVSFWIKFNKGDDEWRTVFGSTTALVDFNTNSPRDFGGDANDPLTWESPTIGTVVQLPHASNGLALAHINGDFELAPFEPALQFEGTHRWAAAFQIQLAARYNEADKELRLSVKRQFLKWPMGYDDQVEGTFAVGNPYISTQATLILKPDGSGGYPVRPHEWYHLAVRWRDFADVSRSSSGAPDVVVSGFFYNDAGTTLHRGTVTSGTVNSYTYLTPGTSVPDHMPRNEDPDYNLRKNNVPNFSAFKNAMNIPNPPVNPPTPLLLDPVWIDVSADSTTDPTYAYNVPEQYAEYVREIYDKLVAITFDDPKYNNINGRSFLARRLFIAAAYMSTDLREAVLSLAYNEVKPGWLKRLYLGGEYAIDFGHPFSFWDDSSDDRITNIDPPQPNKEPVNEFRSLDGSRTLHFNDFDPDGDGGITEQELIWARNRYLQTPFATLDDLGISSQTNISDSTFMPGRYIAPAENSSREVAKFQGKFKPDIRSRATPGCLYWSGRYVADITCDSQDKNGWPQGYPKHVWDEIWQRMTQNAPKPLDFTAITLTYSAHASISVAGNRKNGEVTITTPTGDVTVKIADQYTAETDYSIKLGTPGPALLLKELLISWYTAYTAREGLPTNAAPSTDPMDLYYSLAKKRNNGHTISDNDGKPLSPLSPGGSYDYDIYFLASDDFYLTPAPDSASKPLFNMAVIEEVIFSYQDKLRYHQYREFAR
jgi:hypothetical protein